ncbi:MAG: HPr family phosphocarrier protein [Gemmatimonadota bacterium]|nr:HPr family phosphocarrier protein [Gemmatimonadota bacterium]
MTSIEGAVAIVNPLGLHARPAAAFVKVAAAFTADIHVEKDGMLVNGKSIMGVMTLAAECGSSITIRAVGGDAEAALAALVDLVQRGFDEAYQDY